MNNYTNYMRIQVLIEPQIKTAAEAQARYLGYPSLATMLRVIAKSLAQDYQGPSLLDPLPQAKSAIEKILPASTTPPNPKQFTNWPDYFGPEAAKRDPEQYKFLIDTGLIN